MSKQSWHTPTHLLGGSTPSVSLGMFVRAGEDAHPHYQLIALRDGRAWVRDVQHGTHHIIPFDRCQNLKDGGQ